MRLSWKPALAVTVALLAMTGAALGYAYTVVFGTSGNDLINETGKPGNFHIYAFQGSDTITSGTGNITVTGGVGHVNGYDWLFGDGKCTQTPPGNDSYCVHPSPWSPQLSQIWSDASTATDMITGGTGPDWIYGGGGSNVITGSKTYDVITPGPHKNTITGGGLGDTIIENTKGATSNITLKATKGATYDGLKGVPNWVDVFNGTSGDVVTCSSPSNGDTVYADFGDTVKNCYLVIYIYTNPPGLVSVEGAAQYPPGMSAANGTPAAREPLKSKTIRTKKRVIRIRVVKYHAKHAKKR